MEISIKTAATRFYFSAEPGCAGARRCQMTKYETPAAATQVTPIDAMQTTGRDGVNVGPMTWRLCQKSLSRMMVSVK